MLQRVYAHWMRDNRDVPADAVERILADLRRQGERITPARRTVVEELVGADGHLTADELVERVHETVPGAHLATIYRTMDVLEPPNRATPRRRRSCRPCRTRSNEACSM